MRFTVIVPVYNVEALLPRCLESLEAQTFGDYELLLVDDGSTDGSPALCDAAAARDARIRVVHKRNEGLGSTWMKEGLDLARGDYVGSVDSDDWVDTDLQIGRASCRESKRLPGRGKPEPHPGPGGVLQPAGN